MAKTAPPLPKRHAPAPPLRRPPTRTNKAFSLQPWTGEGQGEKIIVYGPSGIGKTTLCAALPNPAFIGVDDGGRKIRHPVTGEPVLAVPGIETFEDVRAALQSDVFDAVDTVVIDTITEVEQMALPATFARVPISKGKRADNIEDYGYHKGYRHWHDTMRTILSDCDSLVRKGKNIVLIAQLATVRVANPAGEDFLEDAPDLFHDKNTSTMNAYVSWADHVLRLGYSHVEVTKGKAGSSQERAVFVHPEIHFVAKSRTISTDYAVVSFSEPNDDSIWRLVFNGGA